MPLDIYVTTPIASPDPSPFQFSEENEFYFWHLAPWLQRVTLETGLRIDLYEFTEFEGLSATVLLRILMEAKQDVESLPSEWLAVDGQTVLSRERLMQILEQLFGFVERCVLYGGKVVFYGD